MSENTIGQLRKSGGRYEFVAPEFDLVIRGPYPEWVLEAAAEVIYRTERLSTDGKIEEASMLAEMGEGDEMEVDSMKFDASARFNATPQCIVAMGQNDYRWVQKDGREAPDHVYVERIDDMSKTRETSWLQNVPESDI